MNDSKPKSGKKEPKTYINQNPFESLMDIGKGVRKSIVKDLGKDGAYDAWEQLLNPTQGSETGNQGELQPGQEIDLGSTTEKIVRVTEMGSDFASEIINSGQKAKKETSQELQVKYNEILLQLKALGESSKELKAEVEVLTVEQTTENIGIYQLGFVEQLLLKLRELRENVDDGLAWFKALRSKKAAREYGVMARKAGTSFTLSNERNPATQSG